MKLSELAACTGVPVATIKYWIREGLVPRGPLRNERTAVYGTEHRERVELVRTLRTDFDASITTIRALTSAIDRGDAVSEVQEMCQSIASARWLPEGASAPVETPADDAPQRERADALMARMGWPPLPSLAHQSLVRTLAEVDALGLPYGLDLLLDYAVALAPIAEKNLAFVGREGSPDVVALRTLISAGAQISVLVGVNQLAHTSAAITLALRRAEMARTSGPATTDPTTTEPTVPPESP